MSKNKTNFYKILVLVGFAFWVAESAYFGWNDTPINAIEKFADIASQLMILWGLVGDITTNLTITKNENSTINTKNVNINGKPVIQFGDTKK